MTSHEGLAATIPSQATAAHLAAASNPAGSPAERAQAAAAAAAAVLRSGAGRCHLLLLQARQQLAVCLACWHKCGWWPDGVGAVLGEYPSASPALNQIAAEEAEARVKVSRGDPRTSLLCRYTRGRPKASGLSPVPPALQWVTRIKPWATLLPGRQGPNSPPLHSRHPTPVGLVRKGPHGTPCLEDVCIIQP